MHIPRQDNVIARRARVSENIQDHLRRATMGHPVFRIHQQRKTAPAEHFLHRLDQLHTKDRRRRDDDRRGVIQQFLLQLAERFPIEQPRRLLQRHLAAPAPGARIDHHQRRAGGQHVMPLLKLQQVIDQVVLHRAVQVTVLPGRAELRSFLQQILERVRVIAPTLTQHVGDQRIADDPLGKRMPVGRFLPLRGKVPVIGNIVVIENHQARQMRQRPGHTPQASFETIDARLLQRIQLTALGSQHRRLWRNQRPGRRRPHQQVHRHHLGKRHQMIVGTAAGENRLARPTEKPLTQRLVALKRR